MALDLMGCRQKKTNWKDKIIRGEQEEWAGGVNV